MNGAATTTTEIHGNGPATVPVIAPPTLQFNVSPDTNISVLSSPKPQPQTLTSGEDGKKSTPQPAQPQQQQQLANQFRVGHQRKKLILCFDGTGNKFKGNSGDTNILKIFRMLDRSNREDHHYYQPGIGTYITNGNLSRIHVGSRMKSWTKKAMDAAVGTSFDHHVMGGYKFLMRFYSPGDDIYMFGFSRGAYTARFLAEMLDHVGLVSPGNEEMVLFAWKTFSNWQQRQDNVRKQQMYNYMRAFRETFARPVRRVRFLGLFDTVNSVPRFEQAWLKRSRGFPYSARSTARVVRHAVGIDERRAKFRQDLVEKIDLAQIAQQRSWKNEMRKQKAKKRLSFLSTSPSKRSLNGTNGTNSNNSENGAATNGNHPIYHAQRLNGNSPANLSVQSFSRNVIDGAESMVSLNILMENDSDSEGEDEKEQDIEEVWFPGCHGDIGGGWDLPDDEEPLSHGPLVWMVLEARKAGVRFDKQRMKEMNCWIDEFEEDTPSSYASVPADLADLPTISISDATPTSPTRTPTFPPTPTGPEPAHHERHSAKDFLHRAYTRSKMHDCLLFNNGLSHVGVIGWKVMEYLPFRRMDLQPDGSWKAIVWPLPCGEVRDIPHHVKVHTSVLKRMESDPTYRPGNLLVGGGGRGCRVAPKEYGTGDWIVVKDKGNPVGELFMKRSAYEEMKTKERRLKGESQDMEDDEKRPEGL